MRKEKGFTLVELVVLIAILAILSAIAIPQYITLTRESRSATVTSTSGSLNSAVALSIAKYLAAGNAGSSVTTVNMGATGSTAVRVNAGTGVPVATVSGIGRALSNTAGLSLSYSGGTATFRPAGGSATCQASYNGTSGVTTVITTGC